MDFSQPRVFVLQPTNTLPTTGSTQNLAASQFGVFRTDNTTASSGNVTAQKYFYFAQGRNAGNVVPSEGSKKSPFILSNGTTIQEWYKVTAVTSATNQITTVNAISAQCGETVSLTIRLDSYYLRQAFYNGLTRTFTVQTPCCACGADPCTDVDDSALVDQFLAAINADPLISQYVVATRSGTGNTSTLIITGKSLAADPTNADPTTNSFQYDLLTFAVFAYTGPEGSQDYQVYDRCDVFATVTTTQTATYLRGTSQETKQLEQNLMGYEHIGVGKELYSNVNFNNVFSSEVVNGTFYDIYYLKIADTQRHSYQDTVPMTYEIYILNPTGQNASTLAVLTAGLGTPVDKS